MGMKLEYKSCVVPDHTALPAESQDYLTEYGWKQSMADSHAGSFKKVKLDWQDRGTFVSDDDPDFLAAVDVQIEADCAKRLGKILDGTMSIRDSDPLRAIAVEWIRKEAAKQKKELPGGKTDAYRALVARTLEKHRVAIQKEYDRRGKLPPVELD